MSGWDSIATRSVRKAKEIIADRNEKAAKTEIGTEPKIPKDMRSYPMGRRNIIQSFIRGQVRPRGIHKSLCFDQLAAQLLRTGAMVGGPISSSHGCGYYMTKEDFAK